MLYEIIHSSAYKTTHWGAGSTTELFIYPTTSNYAERNFTFRISIATIEESGSKFTSLEGVNRILMMLDGKVTLNHEGKYSKELQPFQQDEFDGGWSTSSTGIGKDFNLMMKNSQGNLTAIHEKTKINNASSMTLIYSFQGTTEYNGHKIPEEDLMIIHGTTEGIVTPEKIAIIISIEL